MTSVVNRLQQLSGNNLVYLDLKDQDEKKYNDHYCSIWYHTH